MRLTTSGIVFAIAGVALIVAAYRFGVPPFLPAGLLLVALVVFSLLIGWALGSRVRADTHVASPEVRGTHIVRAGSSVRVRADLTNPLPFGTGAFTLVLHTAEGFGPTQHARIPSLGARSKAAVDADFSPESRGVSGIERITTEFAGPFALSMRRVRLAHRVPVAVAPMQLPMPFGSTAGRDADAQRSPRITRGVGARDFETRPYVPGDDLRHVDWKSTARQGEMMVRTEAEESSPRLDIVIDVAAASAAVESLLAAVTTCMHNAVDDGATVALHTPDGDSVVVADGDTAPADLFLARLQPGAATDITEPLPVPGGFAVFATDAHDPQARAAVLLRPGLRRRIWDTGALGDSAVGPKALAEGFAGRLPWRLDAGWAR